MTAIGGARHDEGGSATAELVVMTPLLCAILGLFIVGGVLWLDHQVLDDAARSAAEAAALKPSPLLAGDIARSVARQEVTASNLRCTHLKTTVVTTHFAPGGDVRVRITCRALTPPLAFLPLPRTTVLRSSGTDPLEPYRLLGR
jgi:Flp pilus assembly protein TadG